jgi:cyclic dehypoxanthinyl futalosine synthase
VLRGIRQRFPTLWIEGLSASEILSLAAGTGLDLRETIARLRDAGLDSIASDDAQAQCGAEEWLAVHRAAHGLGMSTVATMHFGAGQALELRVDLLAAVRQLQQETGGFTAFIPRSLPSRNASGGWDGPTAVEQLKTLAIARVFLDNIENIQLNGAAQGLKVLQMGLRFGANDAGSVAPQALGAKAGNGASTAGGENAAAANRVSEEDLRRIIRDAGFQPVQRDTPYRTMFLN